MHSSTVRRIGVALLAIGLVTTALSVYSGLIRFYLVVIVPVLSSDNALGSLPLLAIFAGIVLMTIGPGFADDGPDQAGGSASPLERTNEGRTKVGGVVLIGPIPILFGSDRKMALLAAAVAITLLATMVLLLL